MNGIAFWVVPVSGRALSQKAHHFPVQLMKGKEGLVSYISRDMMLLWNYPSSFSGSSEGVRVETNPESGALASTYS